MGKTYGYIEQLPVMMNTNDGITKKLNISNGKVIKNLVFSDNGVVKTIKHACVKKINMDGRGTIGSTASCASVGSVSHIKCRTASDNVSTYGNCNYNNISSIKSIYSILIDGAEMFDECHYDDLKEIKLSDVINFDGGVVIKDDDIDKFNCNSFACNDVDKFTFASNSDEIVAVYWNGDMYSFTSERMSHPNTYIYTVTDVATMNAVNKFIAINKDGSAVVKNDVCGYEPTITTDNGIVDFYYDTLKRTYDAADSDNWAKFGYVPVVSSIRNIKTLVVNSVDTTGNKTVLYDNTTPEVTFKVDNITDYNVTVFGSMMDDLNILYLALPIVANMIHASMYKSYDHTEIVINGFALSTKLNANIPTPVNYSIGAVDDGVEVNDIMTTMTFSRSDLTSTFKFSFNDNITGEPMDTTDVVTVYHKYNNDEIWFMTANKDESLVDKYVSGVYMETPLLIKDGVIGKDYKEVHIIEVSSTKINTIATIYVNNIATPVTPVEPDEDNPETGDIVEP